jgi:uncharacterized protein (DUF1778 family)
MSTTTKDGRLNIRCDSRARQLLDKATAYAQTSVSDFVLSHALAAAEEVVRANESMALTAMDFNALLAALDGPVEPNAALARAFDRHTEQVRQ